MKVNASTRRQFLTRAGAATVAFTLLPRHVLGGPGFVPPSEKVNIALVGAGGQGIRNAKALLALPDVQIVAVADPAESFSLERFYYGGLGGRGPARAVVGELGAGVAPGRRCKAYEDFRVMLEREKSVDAVLCATPDHLHAGVSVMAMRGGKHVYCEKPLTHNLREARLVARIALETGVATQMGNHGHSTVGIRETVEHLQAGTIGVVREVHAWSTARRTNLTLVGKPADAPPVPADMNWDLWLGPREPRAFHPAYHPVGWRDFWAFGNGGIGDMGCHDLDAAVWGCDLHAPVRVEGSGAGPTDSEIGPHASTIRYDFPARAGRPPVRVTWYDGGLMPPTPDVVGGFPLPRRGVLFLGDKGAIQCDGAGGAPRLFPESLRARVAAPPATQPRSRGHHRDWIDACKGGPPASSHFGYGARLTEIVLLGALAVRLRRRIEWHAEALSVQRELAGADEIIRGTYRTGWEVA